MSTERDVRDAQRQHWQTTFQDNPSMYGSQPSEAGAYAVDLFTREQVHDVLELGAGQGRDALAFLDAGMRVIALDYAPQALNELRGTADVAEAGGRLTTLVHDVRQPLPLPTGSVDAVYSHMLMNMALTDTELDALNAEVRRVLRPGGLHVYTVRHAEDAHYRAGIPHGDNMFECGGFIVHFFDEALVQRLATGFSVLDWTAFEEGALPRRLWRVTLRRDPDNN